MAFKLPDSYNKRIRPEYKELLESGRKLNWAEYQTMRGNSYEFEMLLGILDDDALIKAADHYRSNSNPRNYPANTYDNATIHVIVPLLIKRLEEVRKLANKLCEIVDVP